MGDLGVISFNGNKLITTGGGGVIITNNEKLALDCRHLQLQQRKNTVGNLIMMISVGMTECLISTPL